VATLAEYAEGEKKCEEKIALLELQNMVPVEMRGQLKRQLEELIGCVPKKKDIKSLLWWNLGLLRDGETHKLLPIPQLNSRFVTYSPVAFEVLFKLEKRYTKMLKTVKEHHRTVGKGTRYTAPEHVQLARSHLVFSGAMNARKIRRRLITSDQCKTIVEGGVPIYGPWYISSMVTDGVSVSILLEKLIPSRKNQVNKEENDEGGELTQEEKEKETKKQKEEYSKKMTLRALKLKRGVIWTSQIEKFGAKEFQQLLGERGYVYGVDPGIHNLVMGCKMGIDGKAQVKKAFRLSNKQVLVETHRSKNRKILEKEKHKSGIDKLESSLPCKQQLQQYLESSLQSMEQRVKFYGREKLRRLKFDSYIMKRKTIQRFVDKKIEENSVSIATYISHDHN